MVLHRPTRRALPSTTATHLATWISRNPGLRAGYPERAAFLAPYVRDGLRFGIRHGLLALEQGGVSAELKAGRARGELSELLRSASFAGRWLAKIERPSTAFAMLGVKP
jgi:hypothetical protein